MAGIMDFLNKIKNAVYGKDVRQAIYDAIYRCYQDATGNPESVSRLVSAVDQLEQDVAGKIDTPSAAGVSGQVLLKTDAGTAWGSGSSLLASRDRIVPAPYAFVDMPNAGAVQGFCRCGSGWLITQSHGTNSDAYVNLTDADMTVKHTLTINDSHANDICYDAETRTAYVADCFTYDSDGTQKNVNTLTVLQVSGNTLSKQRTVSLQNDAGTITSVFGACWYAGELYVLCRQSDQQDRAVVYQVDTSSYALTQLCILHEMPGAVSQSLQVDSAYVYWTFAWRHQVAVYERASGQLVRTVEIDDTCGGAYPLREVEGIVIDGGDIYVLAGNKHQYQAGDINRCYAVIAKCNTNTGENSWVNSYSDIDRTVNIYIDANGAATGNGTETNPFCMIEQAISVIHARVISRATLYVRGDFADPLILQSCGGVALRVVCWGDSVSIPAVGVWDANLLLDGITIAGTCAEEIGALIGNGEAACINMDARASTVRVKNCDFSNAAYPAAYVPATAGLVFEASNTLNTAQLEIKVDAGGWANIKHSSVNVVNASAFLQHAAGGYQIPRAISPALAVVSGTYSSGDSISTPYLEWLFSQGFTGMILAHIDIGYGYQVFATRKADLVAGQKLYLPFASGSKTGVHTVTLTASDDGSTLTYSCTSYADGSSQTAAKLKTISFVR